jgi:predicted nucleotidyltransferase
MSRKKDKIPNNQVNLPDDPPEKRPSGPQRSDIASLFGSETRAIVIWTLLNHPDQGLTQADVARVTSKDPKDVQRALDTLEQIELVLKFITFGGTISPYTKGRFDPEEAVRQAIDVQIRTSGGTRRYRLNMDHPWVPGLRIILESSSLGAIHLLQKELEAFPVEKRKPHVAFVFGSFAIGEQTPESDIDLVVIGWHDRTVMAEMMDLLEHRTARQINYIEYTREEWKGALEEDLDFARSIMAKPKVFLIGDNERLERISKT